MAGTSRLSRVALPALAAVSLALLSSCGPRADGWGVVLWGSAAPGDPSGIPATGSVAAVIGRSEADGTYLLAAQGGRGGVEVAAARVRVFGKKAEASSFAAGYAPYAATWAFSQKQDPPPLPIREEAKPDAKTVYKLKPGQLLKVVSRSAEKQAVKPYTDFWYEVVTDDGFGGWVFGHFLKVFTAEGDPGQEAARLRSQDETLDRILGTTWRPDYFREMVAKGRFDLAVFREDVGLFPSPAENLLRLVLPLSTFEFRYTGIEKLGASSYVFTGTDLRITVLDEQRITVNYRIKDQPVSGLYAVMEDDVAEVAARELERRAGVLARFTQAGSTFSSSSYGTIRISADGRFAWQGFERLVPAVVGPRAGGGGRIDFPLHLSKALAAAWDGALTLVFDEDGQEASFLYKAVPGGVRMSSLAGDSVKDLEVVSAGFAPVVIFFSQSAQ